MFRGDEEKEGTPLTQAEYSFYYNYDTPVELRGEKKVTHFLHLDLETP